MAISEMKMQMVIANYFKSECDTDTSIRQAFEKGFRIGVKKGASMNRPQGEWIDDIEAESDGYYWANCSVCGMQIDVHENRGYYNYCPHCGAKMDGERREP